MPRGQTSRHSGFTLIELMVAIAVAAIILTVGIPSFISTINGARITSATNDFLVELAYARTEAIRRGQRITMCASANANAANPACNGGPWTTGWLMFEDLNRNAALDAGETILRRHEALPNNLTIIGNGNVTSFVSYTQSGNASLAGVNAGAQGGTIRVCMTHTLPANNARDINLDPSGSGRTSVQPQNFGGACPAP